MRYLTVAIACLSLSFWLYWVGGFPMERGPQAVEWSLVTVILTLFALFLVVIMEELL